MKQPATRLRFSAHLTFLESLGGQAELEWANPPKSREAGLRRMKLYTYSYFSVSLIA